MLEEKRNRLRKFGFVLSAFLLFFSLLFFFRKPGSALIPVFGGAASGSLLLAVFMPQWLAFPEFVMRKFGEGVGWINSRIILFILFYLVFTPLGLLLRLSGKRSLETTFDRRADSYWKDYEHSDNPERYPRQF